MANAEIDDFTYEKVSARLHAILNDPHADLIEVPAEYVDEAERNIGLALAIVERLRSELRMAYATNVSSGIEPLYTPEYSRTIQTPNGEIP